MEGTRILENKMQVFSSEQFGNVRAIMRDGEPWFVAADICKALEIGNPSQVLVRLEDDEKMNTLISNEGNQRGNPNMTVVNESGLYALIFGSRKPEAKVFKRWVTHEVLPTIRKTGGYVQAGREEEFIERYFPAFSDETKLIMVKDLRTQVLALKADNAKQQAQLAEQQPKVEFADHVADSKTLLTVSAFAKIVQNEDIKLGRNKLMAWLRDSGYLRANNEPYQQYIKQGLFRVREVYVNGIFYPVTFITGKGQLYLVEKLRAEFCAA